MVSITTYAKETVKAVLYTEIKGREVNGEWSIAKEKGDSVILNELKAIRLGLMHIRSLWNWRFMLAIDGWLQP